MVSPLTVNVPLKVKTILGRTQNLLYFNPGRQFLRLSIDRVFVLHFLLEGKQKTNYQLLFFHVANVYVKTVFC